MVVKRSAREIKEMEFAQKNADKAIQRYLETNIETLGWLRDMVTELVKAQGEIQSHKDTIENRNADIERLGSWLRNGDAKELAYDALRKHFDLAVKTLEEVLEDTAHGADSFSIVTIALAEIRKAFLEPSGITGKLALAVKALKFYANPATYDIEHLNQHGYIIIDKDNGELAVAALKEMGAME